MAFIHSEYSRVEGVLDYLIGIFILFPLIHIHMDAG